MSDHKLIEEARTEAAEQESGDVGDGSYCADLLRKLAAALEAAEQPIDSYACQRCGRADGLDAVVPDAIWAKLEEKSGCQILCLWCIDHLCAEIGWGGSASLFFAGKNVTGTSQSDTDAAHIRKLAERSEAAEGREDRTDTMLTIAIGTRDDALRQLDALHALLPALKALDEAGKKATDGEWASMGHSNITKGVIFVDSGKTPIAKVYEQPTWTRGNAHFMCRAANSRPAIAEAVRILEGRE